MGVDYAGTRDVGQEGMNRERIGLMEKLAEAQHAIWSHWMRYQLARGGAVEPVGPDNCWVMNPVKYERWQGRACTSYADLSEEEKESDRKVVEEHLGWLLEILGTVEEMVSCTMALDPPSRECWSYWECSDEEQELCALIRRAKRESGIVDVRDMAIAEKEAERESRRRARSGRTNTRS